MHAKSGPSIDFETTIMCRSLYRVNVKYGHLQRQCHTKSQSCAREDEKMQFITYACYIQILILDRHVYWKCPLEEETVITVYWCSASFSRSLAISMYRQDRSWKRLSRKSCMESDRKGVIMIIKAERHWRAVRGWLGLEDWNVLWTDVGCPAEMPEEASKRGTGRTSWR